MNIQTRRDEIVTALSAIKPSGWEVTAETDPDIHGGMIQVGHAVSIEPLSYTKWAVEFLLTIWVSEADTVDAATTFYGLLSPGDGSIITKLNDTGLFKGPVQFEGAEPRKPNGEGSETYLAGDLRVRVLVSA